LAVFFSVFALSLVGDVVTGHGVAEAKSKCGAEGQRACKVWERVPSCKKGLKEKKGKCVKKKKKKKKKLVCGKDGQRACKVWERVPSCDKGLAERSGKCHECGGEGETVCPVTVKFPAACDKGLMSKGGKCHECGGKGEYACPVTVKFPSCDKDLMEKGGKCHACGAEGENACPITVRIPSCEKELVERKGKCVWSKAVPRDPFTFFNRSSEKLYYSVAKSDDRSGRIEMLKDGSIDAGDARDIVLGHNDCYTDRTQEQETNPGFAFIGTREDSCKGKSFNVFIWGSEKNYKDYATSVALSDLVTAAFSEWTGSDLIGEYAYSAYLDWLYDQAGGSVTQEDRWLGYWGRRYPLEIGISSSNPGDPEDLSNPCSRAVGDTFFVTPKGAQVQVNGGCGGIHAPG
jgi:hypothetical protein